MLHACVKNRRRHFQEVMLSRCGKALPFRPCPASFRRGRLYSGDSQ